MPCWSIGFSVAITTNGVGNMCVTPSTVTCRSSMGSRSADCVRGVVRLISSTSTTFAKIGPGWKRNSCRPWSYTLIPVTSEGSRSGVAWIRLKSPPIERASARASIVLPTPGTPSSSRLPSASRQIAAVSTTVGLPAMTRSTFSTRRRKAAVVSPTKGSGRLTSRVSTFGGPRLRRRRPGPARSSPGQRLAARALIASTTHRCARSAVTSDVSYGGETSTTSIPTRST